MHPHPCRAFLDAWANRHGRFAATESVHPIPSTATIDNAPKGPNILPTRHKSVLGWSTREGQVAEWAGDKWLDRRWWGKARKERLMGVLMEFVVVFDVCSCLLVIDGVIEAVLAVVGHDEERTR